ncbi:MAG: phytanoyl-CoA dioxygenase family protein [Planctomycetota bacterium]|nr:phytanoyl-CoA dioxygenase family protein [Planctomycetota bacterium]
MRYTAQQIATYQRDGVLPLGKVLTDAQIQGAREHIETLIAENKVDRPESAPGKHAIRRLEVSQHDPWFMGIVRSDAIVDAGEAAIGPNVQMFQDNIFYKPASVGGSTPFHQDNIWWNVNPPAIMTIWIALDEVDETNGPVQYVRGSNTHLRDHTLPVNDPCGAKYNVIDPATIDRSKIVTFKLQPGEAVMHHCLTIHGAPENQSPRPRRAYTVHLMQAGLSPRELDKYPLLRGSMPLAAAAV